MGAQNNIEKYSWMGMFKGCYLPNSKIRFPADENESFLAKTISNLIGRKEQLFLTPYSTI